MVKSIENQPREREGLELDRMIPIWYHIIVVEIIDYQQ